MKKILYFVLFCTVLGACGRSVQDAGYSASLDRDSVVGITNDVISWQLDNMPEKGREWYNPRYTGWADGVFLGAAAEWKNLPGLRERLESIADECNYEPAPKTFNPANDVAVCMLYADMYLENPAPRFLKNRIKNFQKALDTLRGGWACIIPTIERLDFQMKYWPECETLDFLLVRNQERWSWCDALYMAAPTYAVISNITGNPAYREFMDREFWRTAEYLYSPSDSLFFRDSRFFNKKEKNGKKVFWGRGNGWVIAALARVMELLPESYPSIHRYEALFKQMAGKLASLQGADGYWRTSLLDPEDYPCQESSATGFITYGIWWGINRGLLDKEKFLPVAKAGWEALVAAVQPGGKLGWVQPIGDTPDHISAEKNEVYGTAAFVLTANEILNYKQK